MTPGLAPQRLRRIQDINRSSLRIGLPVLIAEVAGEFLVRLGVDRVCGVVGGSNFHLTNALVGGGVPYVATRHEAGAMTMADGFARASGGVPVVSLHQGNGLTNALTGLVEAVKSHTPLLVLAADTPGYERDSNFYVDQEQLLHSVGARVFTVRRPSDVFDVLESAYSVAVHAGEPVVINLPVDVLHASSPQLDGRSRPGCAELTPSLPPNEAIAHLAHDLLRAHRPVFVAGRGARTSRARDGLETAATRCGALLATTVAAQGLFAGSPWAVDIAGGFSTPTTVELLADADLVVVWGASLNRWTTRDGALFSSSDSTRVVQVDRNIERLAKGRLDRGLVGDVAETASALARELEGHSPNEGYRTPSIAAAIEQGAHWRDLAFDDTSDGLRLDPRVLTRELDRLLPKNRILVSDVGNFAVYPMLETRDHDHLSTLVPIGFASIGLGLSAAIGASLADADRQVIATIGDGGFLMSAVELDTAVRLELPILIVVYNDDAYGAEAQMFGPQGFDTSIVRFPPTDIAAIARGYGCDALTATTTRDLRAVSDWLQTPARDRPLLVDAKVTTLPNPVLHRLHPKGSD